MKKLTVCITMLLIMLIPITNISAQTLNEMYTELKKLQSEQAKVNNGKQMTEAEIKKLKEEIGVIETNIENNEKEIVNTENEIKETENNIETKKDETDSMLLYLQLKNARDNSMLEYIFQAKDYTDFIYRYYTVTQMSDYNNDLINDSIERQKFSFNPNNKIPESPRFEKKITNNLNNNNL